MSTKLTTFRGDTLTKALTFKDENGTAIDITGWTIWFTIKSSQDDADSAAVAQDIVTSHTNATAGESTISLTAAETDELEGNYYYDIQIKKLDGTIKTVLDGTINFSKDITIATV